MESGRKERKKESGGSEEDGEEEREDGVRGQEATETGTPIGGSRKGVLLRPAESKPGEGRRRPECHGDREAERSSQPHFQRSVAITGV
ncbi:hypothetical protein NDU88_006865 [Pleurodeles waltl]|uniref:Uncharacterized protein n=1 Tax=Pleurodeles waltl TaxID=8319 RepID=A0AAV7VSR9_PLEWA|nr:hypothetical protein NDU88_006865 [Pleurodeles waltl]